MSRRWSLAALFTALALMTAPAASGAGPPPSAGWHGREIRDPLPRRVADGVVRFPRGWSAGAVRLGTGYASPNGSRRVREVQLRLRHRGYRVRRVDGRFGPRTRASLIWFQMKHGLPRTGRADARTVAVLREPKQAKRPPVTAAVQEQPSEATEIDRSDPSRWIALAGVLLLGLAVVLAWLRTELRGRRFSAEPAEAPQLERTGTWDERPAELTTLVPPLAAMPPPPTAPPADVIGYISLARGADRDRELQTRARMIGAWCEEHGWHVTRVVHDLAPDGGRIADRPGLAYALDQIARGRVSGLVVAHLGDLTRSVAELVRLLHWADKAGAFVIAVDYELETSTASAARPLVGVADDERRGLTAIRGGVPRHAKGDRDVRPE